MRLPHEDEVVRAAYEDPLLFADLMIAINEAGSPDHAWRVVQGMAMRKKLPETTLNSALAALSGTGVIEVGCEEIRSTVTLESLREYALILRGVAYGKHLHKDTNQVEIALTPPATPSKLMEALPKFGSAWSALERTSDSLVALATQATKQFVIISPFIDAHGIDWIDSLFRAVKPGVRKVLMVRGGEQVSSLAAERDRVLSWNSEIWTFSILHDQGERELPIETFHAKIVLGDWTSAYVGSANMSRWSRDTTLECGTVVRGPAVKAIGSLVDAMISIGTQVSIAA